MQGWAQDGLTDEQIAHNIGINTATLYDWKKDNRPIFTTKDKHGKPINKIDEALKKGKEIVDYAVQNALLKKALSGDTMAIIYWLNNRRPDKWRRNPVPSGAEAEESDNLYQAILEAVKK